MLVLMTASICVLSAGVGAAEDVNATLDPTLNKISEETENKEVLYLKNGYTIRITDINKDVSPHEIRLILEKNSVEFDDKILETGQDYSWHNDEDHITLSAEIFVGTSTNVVFFKNINQISDGNTIIDNETFTLIYSGGISENLNLNTADYKNIEGFTASNKNVLQSSSFPPASGYSREFLKENYSLTLLELDVDGKKAWMSLSKNGEEVYSRVVSVGKSFNYNSLLSFKLDKVFVGRSSNYVEISNIYQYSEINSSAIIQNESALLLPGLTGKFILTGGGLEWQLEENYTLHAIDIDIAGHSREALLLITKDGTHVDYTIINVSDSYTYYQNENLIITADLETIFSGEGGVSLARLHHVYQYSEDTGEILLSDEIHLYSVGNTREVEWQLNQDYSLSAMDIDSRDTPRQVWLKLNKDGNTLEDIFLHPGDSAIFYNSGTKILDLNVGTIFDGREADLVFISDVYQYSETNENDILIENEPHLFIFGNTTGNDWQLYENYTVSFMDIDIKKDPNRVWLRMKKNGVPVDDNVVAQNEEYRFYNNSALLFEGHLNSSFGGRYLDMLTLTNANQYSELDSTSLIVDTTYSFYPENVELIMDSNEKLSLGENYTLVPVDVNVFGTSLWLRLYKDDVMVDEVILLEGQDYSYYSGSIKIISTKLATVFLGMYTEIIKFEDFYQYSEVDGSLLKYYDKILLRLDYYSPTSSPTIISFEPTTFISDVVGATRKFTIFVDKNVNVNWYLNGTEIQLNESVWNAEYTNTSASAGTWIISAIANNANGIAKQNWTWKVNPKTYHSGNRIWDEDAGMSDTYTWDPWSFSGFYYDLDTDEGSETMTIKNIGITLDDGDIEYKTKPIPVEFENSRWGTYEVIGFMADRYFAGYKDTDFASSNDHLLLEDKLSRVLTDNDKKVRLNPGSLLELEEGYEFKITEFSTSGETIMVGLFKDGDVVSETVVKEKDTFVYEKDLGKAEDIPIIAIYIDNVSIEQENRYVNIEGIFQISDKYIDVEKGDEFGLMEITSVSSSGITMKNEDSVNLGEGDDFNLMGKINIIVADDSSTLRFAPYVDMTEPGTYELRGTVTEENEFDWTPFNFEALMYDIDTGEGGETLHLERYGRTVDEGDLTYTINLITQNFEHSNDGWNGFQSIGFMGETCCAGYLEESSFVSSDRSLISEGKLSKILMDEDKNHTIYIGNLLSLQEGYSLRIDEISLDGDTLMLSILKDGDELSTEIVSEGDSLVYEIEVNKTDIPIIVIHIDRVLGDMGGNSVHIDGIFQISDSFTSIEKGDTYGIMEVTKTTPSIVLSNEDDSISLDKGDVIDIMGDIKIKVADNYDNAVRFYPFQEIVVEDLLYLDLDIPNSVHENEEFTISVTSNGDKVENVSITFNDSGIGTTDSNGELIYTPIETGKFKVTASKFGYQDASKYIDVTDPNARLEYSNLTIEPKSVQPGEDVNITVVASNLGTFRNTDTITLKVNGEEVMTKDLSLGPGESTTIEYSLNRSEPGTYLVEVNGQSDTFNVTVNEGIYLDFTVTDAVLSHDGEYLYLSSKPDCKLYIVNLPTGTVDKISFSNMTESLTINPQGDAIYLALLTREHDAYWWDEDGHEGYIAEIDPETRSLVREFRINEDPYDIVATSDGYLYVSSGSGQWTNIRGYDLSTTSEVGSASIRHRSHIKLHPTEGYIYAADTDSSPSDIEKFDLSGRSIQALYDSPYHGDYPMSGDLEISPDGTKIFTRSGHIFRSTESQATDMTHIGSLGSMWNSLTFDEINNVYTVSGTSVKKYNCDTYEAMGGKSINGNGRFIFYNDGYLIVVTEDGEFPTKSSIQIIDATPTPPPTSVTNLNESAVGTTWVNWTWINHADENFNHTMVYINGEFKAKVDKDTNYYKAIGLSPASIHTISTHTVDIWGNINQTWVNDTATNSEAPDIWVDPVGIKVALLQGEFEKINLTLGNNRSGVLEFEVNDTVDWLSVYPSSGIVVSGEQTNIAVDVSADMLINGTYVGDIIIASNDPDEGLLEIPVTLCVGKDSNEGIYIDFTVTDAVLSHDGEYLYLSSKPDCKLNIVNLTTGTVDKISFSNMTESLTINPQGDAIYLALLTREHDAYWWDEDGHEGYIAEIDPETRSLVREFRINEDPYDIVATSDGYLYVSSGSGQWTNIRGYDLSTTSEVGSASIRHRSHIKLHPTEGYIYAADTDSSPSDIEKFDLSGRSIQALYDSPYHGDYPMSGDLEISPDGTKIFTRSGHIFRSTESQATDMTHIGSLGSMWNSLTFDEINNVYTVSGTSVKKYNCDTYEAMGGKSINGNGRFIFYNDGYLIVVTEDGEFPTKSSIQIIDATPTPPPTSVTNLNESAVGTTWVNWTWINHADENFNHTMVYINGEFKAKVDKDTNYYKAIGLSPASIHTISTHTVDIWGNINQTWVNDTATNSEAPDIWVDPVGIKVALLQGEFEKINLTLGNNRSGVLEFEVNDTVDWLSVYPSSGIVVSGEQTNIAVDVSADMLINGTYVGDIIIASNDPDEGLLEIPVTLCFGPTLPVVLVEDVTAAPNGYAFTSIMVHNVTGLGSGNVSVTFDPSAIQVIDVTSGDENALTVQDYDIDNTAGLVQITAWDAHESHDGDVVFAHVTLHSIGDHLSSTALAISFAELINYDTYKPITHNVATGTLDIIAPVIIIDNVEAAPGESTTALVMVNNASNLGSGNITVTYNSSVVHVTSVTSGDGNALAVQDWNADNTAGSLEIAALDADKSHNGDVVFANVTFHAVGKSPDSTPLDISSSELIDYTSYGIIGHSVTNGTFSIIDNEPPVITDAIATPDVILNDNGRPRTPGTGVTVLNATVLNGGSGVAKVTINLSSIGGSDDQVMERIAGTDVWTVATTATDGINLTHELVVTATDGADNTNTSVIGLTVLLRGDVVRDGNLNSADALYIAKYLVGKEPMPSLLVSDMHPAEGDGKITSADALYLVKYLVGEEAAP